MAKNETKHNSKYKEPKDMAKSLKPEVRSDLKDYIKEIVKDCMWEFSGELQPGPRKDDKWSDDKTYPFVHNHTHEGDKHQSADMVPDRKDADNAYPIKMMQDGDPKMSAHAKKAFEKNIEKDSEEYLETMQTRDGGVTTKKLKESIESLSESQKEKLVRMYVRKKIVKVLQEQVAPTDMSVDDTMTDPSAATAPDATTPDATIPDAETPADDASSSNIESATKTFEDALKDEFLANATSGTEKAMKPLIQHYETNNDQKDEIAQGIANVLKAANITLPAASSTDHTKNDEPEQQSQA